jgi:hypothetical protein
LTFIPLVLALVFRPEEGTHLRNVLIGLFLSGPAGAALALAGLYIWYKFLTDKDVLEKKRAELNAPTLARIAEMEGTLNRMRPDQ